MSRIIATELRVVNVGLTDDGKPAGTPLINQSNITRRSRSAALELIMLRYVPATIWTFILYGLTLVTSGLPVGPTIQPHATAYEIQKSVWWFEFNHAVLHAATFAVLAGLLVFAHRRPWVGKWQVIIPLILFTSALVGVGQEALQSAARSRIVLGNSLFDVACDVAGAAICLVMLRRKPTTRMADRLCGTVFHCISGLPRAPVKHE